MLKNKKVKVKTNDSESSETQINDLKVQLARTLADYDNLKKRVEQEKETWFKISSGRVVARFLFVLDMLGDAQKHLNDQGLAIVLGEFRKAVVEEGFEEIPIELGVTEFDSEYMEAIEVVSSTDKDNVVSDVVQSGWRAKDNGDGSFVIRPAKVKVFKNQVEN